MLKKALLVLTPLLILVVYLFFNQTEVKELTVSSSTTVSDKKLSTLTISPAVGEGEVTITNSDIETLVVSGGGLNSVKLVNSIVGTVISSREDELGVRILLTNSTVSNMKIKNRTILESTDKKSSVKKMLVESATDSNVMIKNIIVDSLVNEKKIQIIKDELANIKETSSEVEVESFKFVVTLDNGVTKVIKYVDENFVLESPKRDGFKFIGWYTVDGKLFEGKITSNMRLVAKWSELDRLTVKFVSNEKVIKEISVLPGATIPLPEVSLEGRAFDGWYIGEVPFTKETKVTENITVTAKWKEPVYLYVKFNTEGGSLVATKKVMVGSKIDVPTSTKEGFEFLGWYLGTTKYDFSKGFSKSVTLTAKWRDLNYYYVTIDVNGGIKLSTSLIKVLKNGYIPEIATPKKYDCTFIKWTVNGESVDFSKPLTSDITLKANWDCPDYGDNHVMLFIYKDKIAEDGRKIVAPGESFYGPGYFPIVETGYYWDGWYYNGVKAKFPMVATKDMVFYGVVKKIEKVKVFLNPQNGKFGNEYYVLPQANFTFPTEVPIKTGYKFLGWQAEILSSVYGLKQPGDSIKVYGDQQTLIFSGKWEEETR